MLFVTAISLGLLASVHGQCALQTIAFSAALSQDQIVGENSLVVFNNIILNNAQAYNSNTGTFTAPVDGVYSFQVSLLTVANKEAWLEIVHNNQQKVSVYAKQGNAYDSASNSVIIKMIEGDRVNVRAHRHSELYGRPEEYYTTFSGQFLSRL